MNLLVLRYMAPPERFELPTAGFEDRCSSTELQGQYLVATPGFEPGITPYESGGLPTSLRSRILVVRAGFEPTTPGKSRPLYH